MVSVIIVNYNGEKIIINCLSSLIEQTYQNFHILIIDNFSSDGSVETIDGFLEKKSLKHKAVVISLKENLGFAGGNIEALKHTPKEKYIVLLNNDTEVDKKWLEQLIFHMEENPDVGICASKLVTYGANCIDSAGDGYTMFLKGDKRGEGQEQCRYETKEYVFGACAGAAIYRREMLEEIGFLDEDFFLIYEDTDLNFRAQLAGWKVMYVPTAIVQHKVRSSIGELSDKAIYYSLRNSELVRIKNIPLGIFFRCLPWFIIGGIGELIYFSFRHKRFRLYLRAKMDALKMFPLMLKKRKEIMKNKKVSNKYIMSIITSIWQRDFFLSKIRKFFHG